jgi:glutamate formiminotransferase
VSILCVPNVSEGRRRAVVDRLAATIRNVAGVTLLDHSADSSHNRSVFTFAGNAERLEQAVIALFDLAVEAIDLRIHRGGHPRVGAVDVVPFVPLEPTEMAECVALARSVGAAVAARFHVPVYLYEEASTNPMRRSLEDIRRGEFEGLAAKMAMAGWQPDFGPPRPHPTAGASVVGARGPLIAFNVNLATNRIDVAKTVAATVRQSGGGLRHVKAIGVRLEDRDIVQVSMNLTDFRRTPVVDAFAAVAREAARFGVSVLESEIVGLVPEAALSADAAPLLKLARFGPGQVLERRLEADA